MSSISSEIAALRRRTPLALEQGRDAAQVVSEAVERLVDYDTWFMKAVQEGQAYADRDELLLHDEVVQRVEAMLAKP